VEAYDLEGDILIAREFYINTTVVDTKPYENLYLAARPAIHERDSFEILRQDTEVIPSELIYRPTDPYFGVAPDIRFLLANGLNPSTALAYKQNMWLNHATRRLFFGNIKTAQVLNSDNSVRYEVVYVDVIDTYENAEGVTVSKVVDSSNKITEQLTVDQSVYDASQVFITGDEATEGRDYPASLDNMRTQINNTIGVSNSNTLPAWMSSKQSTGRSLGMVYAVPLVYTVPNASNKIAYRIRDKYPNLFEQIEFLVDQYIWDCNLSSNYDQTNQRYYTSNETTFDKLSVHDYGVDVTVDFGVNQQFDSINGQTLENVIANGGIDGITYNLNGKHLVFLREDNFPVGSSPENSGWNDYPSLFDEDVFDSYTYDQMDVVPGYFEKLNGSSTQNKRAGVWKVVISSTNVVTLEFLQEIDFFSVIEITAGVSNANKLVYYDPDIKQGFAAPSYTEVPQNAENYSRTVFDGNSTRFNSYRDVYSIPDENDKYLKFPKSGVFA
jgi:hypothetical protein